MNIKKLNHFKPFKYNNKQSSFNGATTKNMMKINGTQTTAKVFTTTIDELTKNQIKTICSHPIFEDLPIRIMPDTHAGSSTVVGFTAPIGRNGEIIPSILGSDIGCGMLCVEIDTNGEDINFEKLDQVIKTYISSSHDKIPTRKKEFLPLINKQLEKLCNGKLNISTDKMIAGLGTIGGGNHFIELDKSENGKTYLVIHTGSRGFGKAIHDYHQNVATQQNPYFIDKLSHLSGDEAKDYFEDMRLAQKFAELNRRIIADEIIKQMGWEEKSSFESIHNYIDSDNIIRKGAISSNLGQKIIIPLNMRDGALIATGKGNKDWNSSAPHGAGRKISRSEAMKKIALEEYKKSMQGIYTSCICDETIDESPQAYKDACEIELNIQDTASIIDKIKPIFNFKNKK